MNRRGRRQIDDFLDFKRIDVDALFGHHETQESTGFDVEDTLMRVQPDIIVSKTKKYDYEMCQVISTFCGMSRKVVKVWLNYVLDVMKSIRHSSLEGGPDIL